MVGGVGYASRLGIIFTDVSGGADTRATPLPYNRFDRYQRGYFPEGKPRKRPDPKATTKESL